MENFIKYERIEKKLYEKEINGFFDELVANGWEIITYNEKELKNVPFDVNLWSYYNVMVIVGKRQSNVL